MFERFTERARQVVVLAQDEARTLRHNYIGTEHILLGLLREEEGIAARVLESLDVSLDEIRPYLAQIVGQGDEITTGQIPFTPRAKKVLELSLREALAIGHNYIGTEHILLGLARENEGVASRILLDFDVDAETIRSEVLGMLSGAQRLHSVSAVESAAEVEVPQYTPTSPPVTPEVAQEIERVRTEKEAAIEGQEFERAAKLRQRERDLIAAAKALETAWRGESKSPRVSARAAGRVHTTAMVDLPKAPLVLAVVLAAIGFPIGLLLGWLIWA
jgi:ATP-dependent Clp protease ATP-binding subunit ClpC